MKKNEKDVIINKKQTEVIILKTLELIVPCFNEGNVLELFFNEVSPVLNRLSDYDYRYIFVNDGSTDKTLAVLKSLAKKDSRVKYVSLSRNFGKEAAMLAGLSRSSADYVGIIDADLQHSPELIPQMLTAITEEGYDVAAAKRSDRNGESKFKSFLSDSFYKISNAVSDVKIDQGAQDFRIMNRKVVEAILSMPEYGRFTKGIFSYVGFKTKWFTHENRERAAGETKWSVQKLFKYALDGILSFSSAPLKIPACVGIVLFIIGIIEGLILFFVGCSSKYAMFTSHTTNCLIMIVGGLVLLCLGIIGEYIARIYNEVKGRPVYIINESNFD